MNFTEAVFSFVVVAMALGLPMSFSRSRFLNDLGFGLVVLGLWALGTVFVLGVLAAVNGRCL